MYAKSNRLRHQLSHYQKLFPEETPDPGHHAVGEEPATVARPKTVTRNKGKTKAPLEQPDKSWSEMYRGASAAKRLKRKFELFSRKMELTFDVVDPNALPYVHGVFDKQ